MTATLTFGLIPRPLLFVSALLVLVLVGGLSTGQISRIGDSAAAGQRIAEQHCGPCHNVAAGPAALVPHASGAPSLAGIARTEPDLFEGVLLRPSQPMRGVQVPAEEVAALRSWLQRLQQDE